MVRYGLLRSGYQLVSYNYRYDYTTSRVEHRVYE